MPPSDDHKLIVIVSIRDVDLEFPLSFESGAARIPMFSVGSKMPTDLLWFDENPFEYP